MSRTVQHDGEEWRVLGVGRQREDGKVYAHLASVTRGKQQRNGWHPAQICDWVDLPETEPEK